MKKALACSLLLLALTSCSSTPSRPNESYFVNQDDPDLPYMTRNGDNYGRKGVSYSYDEVSRGVTVESISHEIDSGKSVFLFLHMDTCSHCSAAHDDYVNAWLDSGLEVFALKFIQSNPQPMLGILHELGERYPAYASAFNNTIYTPSTYLLDNADKIRVVGVENQRESLQNLEEFLKNLMNFTYVYTFRTFDSYLSFAKENECLVYRHGAEDAFFYDTIYPLAKHSKLHTAELQVEYFSEADKKRCEEYFGEADLGLVKGNALSSQISVTKSPDQAGQLIRSYYKA